MIRVRGSGYLGFRALGLRVLRVQGLGCFPIQASATKVQEFLSFSAQGELGAYDKMSEAHPSGLPAPANPRL